MRVETGTTTGQNVMQQPPDVLTTKDLMYIKDALSWELLAAKKCFLYSQIAKEQAVKDICSQFGMKHQAHYQLLLNHLNPNNSADKLQ